MIASHRKLLKTITRDPNHSLVLVVFSALRLDRNPACLKAAATSSKAKPKAC
jgi:hypothetical protein